MEKKRELNVERWAKLVGRDCDALNELEESLLKGRDDVMNALNAVYETQIAGAWVDAGMQVYDFDKDFSESILGEKWAELLPDCLGNRPHDCFYMKLPCGKSNEGAVVYIVDTESIIGFNAALFPGCTGGKGVYHGGDERFGRRTVVNTGGRMYSLCYFSIPKTIELMLDGTELEHYPTELVANGVAYLCSLNADIAASYIPRKGLKPNRAKRRSLAIWHDVGYRVGSELRAYRRYASEHGEDGGGTVRPHMRRAHWHHYWTGPRNGERRLVLKWIAPTMVGVGRIESATVHRAG